jgi:DNA polymerase-3 subunit gamma/tau
MASQSLYRKWRSQTFSDLVGQEPIVRTLCNAVRDGRLAHAYLFCGPRGTGKTSAARLLAKAVNCANPHGGEPCNQCLSCREIAEGRSPDVIEIDAASNNSVDDIRELRGNVNVLTTGGRYKVYVIDEAHMLSTQAFNALLKTLEEPPPHVIFVLATTEAHKMLPTIVSRCQRFDFRRHTWRNIVARLNHVAEGEGLTLEPAAAELLARAAQGGMRDALSLLDQAMAFCGSQIALGDVRAMLGLADAGAVRALVEHVADGRAAEGLQLIHELVEAGADLRQLNSQIAEFWRALVLARAGADVATIMDCGREEASEYAALARHFALDDLTACARVFAANETPARGLPVPQLGLELSYLECVGIRRRADEESMAMPQLTRRAAPIDMPGASLGAQASLPAAAVPPAGDHGRQPPVAPVEPRPAPAMPRPEAPPPTTAIEDLDHEAPEPTDIAAHLGSSPSALLHRAAPQAEESAAPPSLARDEGQGVQPEASDDWLRRAQEQWELVKKVCKQKKRTVAAFLNNARPVSVIPGDPLEVVLEADFDFHLKSLREPENRAGVEWALEQVLGQRCRVRLVPAGSGGTEGSAGSGGSGGETSRGRGGGRAAAPPAQVSDAPSANGKASPPPPLGDAGHNGRGGNGHQANGMRDGVAGYAEYAGEGWQVLASQPAATSAASASPVPESAAPSRATLEEEARADPVVQAIVRAFPAELAEVRPIALDEEA